MDGNDAAPGAALPPRRPNGVSLPPAPLEEVPVLQLIPKVMSTQHPDNAESPPYAVDGVIKGDGEIIEAADVFALGCDEQMWDSEGKDADTHVVQKLLSNYPAYFREQKRLGRDAVITLRVPNPSIEVEMRKLLVEALQGIPTAYDVASEFYEGGVKPPHPGGHPPVHDERRADRQNPRLLRALHRGAGEPVAPGRRRHPRLDRRIPPEGDSRHSALRGARADDERGRHRPASICKAGSWSISACSSPGATPR